MPEDEDVAPEVAPDAAPDVRRGLERQRVVLQRHGAGFGADAEEGGWARGRRPVQERGAAGGAAQLQLDGAGEEGEGEDVLADFGGEEGEKGECFERAVAPLERAPWLVAIEMGE